MDPTAPSHHQPARLFAGTEEIESSALDISDIKEAADLAPLMLRYLMAVHAAARARRGAQGTQTRRFTRKPRNHSPRARKAAPQRKGRAA